MTAADPVPETPDVAEPGEVPDRDARLAAGADRLRHPRRALLAHPRLLVTAAAALMTTGVGAVIVGWIGAAHTTLVPEQIPYLISGGLLGVALSTIGALLFFTHWLTVGIKEARQHEAARRHDHEELIEALHALGAAKGREEEADGRARGSRAGRPLRSAPSRR
jgi:hypothetical protein